MIKYLHHEVSRLCHALMIMAHNDDGSRQVDHAGLVRELEDSAEIWVRGEADVEFIVKIDGNGKHEYGFDLSVAVPVENDCDLRVIAAKLRETAECIDKLAATPVNKPTPQRPRYLEVSATVNYPVMVQAVFSELLVNAAKEGDPDAVKEVIEGLINASDQQLEHFAISPNVANIEYKES